MQTDPSCSTPSQSAQNLERPKQRRRRPKTWGPAAHVLWAGQCRQEPSYFSIGGVWFLQHLLDPCLILLLLVMGWFTRLRSLRGFIVGMCLESSFRERQSLLHGYAQIYEYGMKDI